LTTTFEVVDKQERVFAYIRHMGPFMGDTELFANLFNQVGSFMKKNGLFQTETEAISIYHDDPKMIPPSRQRISVGFTVPATRKGEGEVQIMKIPAGKYLVGSFEIDPDEYGAAWDLTFEYLRTQQLRPNNGIMYESYKNDPNVHPDGKHVVDICVSVA